MTDDELGPDYKCGAWWMTRPRYYLLVVLASILAVILFGCGLPAAAPVDPQPTVPDTVAVAPPPVPTTSAIAASAVAVATAAPLVERTTLPPPDPCGAEAQAYVNTLPYEPDTPEPVIEGMRVVATCLGWTPTTIDLYRPGIITDIMPGESRFCWGLQRGQGIGPGCSVFGDICGTCSDTGFFQITRDGWGPRGLLCVNGFYCSAESIKRSPWDAMRSGLLLIMLNPDRPGQPWTWDAKACRYHSVVCTSWPDDPWVNLP